MKTVYGSNICTPMVTALFTTGKTWKQIKCPLTDEWVKKKKHCTYTHTTEYYSAIKGRKC